MLTSVDFNHNAPLETNVIDDVVSNRLLTFELETGETASSKMFPQRRFSIGWLMAHRFCEFQ